MVKLTHLTDCLLTLCLILDAVEQVWFQNRRMKSRRVKEAAAATKVDETCIKREPSDEAN